MESVLTDFAEAKVFQLPKNFRPVNAHKDSWVLGTILIYAVVYCII